MKKNTIRAVALLFGYAEESTTSWLIFTTHKPFTSRKAALLSLTEYLYQKYKHETKYISQHNNEHKLHMAKCCQKAWSRRDKNNPPERCPECEALFTYKKETFSVSDWITCLYNMHDSTCDSYGEEPDDDCGWSPWQFDFSVTRDNMLIIGCHAEAILTIALAEIHPELGDNLSEDDYTGFDYFDKEREKNYIDDEMECMLNGKVPGGE